MSEPLLPLTLEQQTQALANYLPTGRAFGAKNVQGSVTRKLLEGLAVEAGRADQLVLDFLREILPDQTVQFLEEWESAVGIPDDCFNTSGTLAERRRNVLAKLSAEGLQTCLDFITLANKFGVAVQCEGGSVNGTFPYVFPMIFFGSAKEAHFTIIINFSPLPANLVFPYTFPIPFGNADIVLVQCLFRHLKPANVQILFVNL